MPQEGPSAAVAYSGFVDDDGARVFRRQKYVGKWQATLRNDQPDQIVLRHTRGIRRDGSKDA